MNAAALVGVIEENTRQLISELNSELKTNLGTSHYHRLTDDELLNRGIAVFQGLTEWIVSRNESAIQSYGEDLGMRRFTQGIPLGQVVLALILIEKHIWAFLDATQEQVDESSRNAITEYFQKIAYYTAKGYESSLAVSNRLAQRATVQQLVSEVAQAPRKEAGKEGRKDRDMEISRGGQVGEFGG